MTDAEKSEEVGGDKVGKLGTLGSTSSKESPISMAEVTSGDKAIMGGSGDEQIYDPVQQSVLSSKGFTNKNKQRDERGSVDLEEIVEEHNVTNRYLGLGKFLATISGYHCKRSWQFPSAGAKPLVPRASPISGIIESKTGVLTVTKLVPKDNTLFVPAFFGDRRVGFSCSMPPFRCPDSFTSTFDLCGGCRVCCTEHQVFPSKLMGTLVVGDAYTPTDLGGKGLCVPVYRQHNAGFRDIRNSLRFILHPHQMQGGSYAGSPNLIIISLPAYLKAVGPEHYLNEFQAFKGWAKHFLQTGCDWDMDDPHVFEPCDNSVEVCEGFALFKRGDSGLAESFAVIQRSLKILTAHVPSNKSNFFYEVTQKVMVKHCIDYPPQTEMTRYHPIYPVRPEFEVYDHGDKYEGLPESCFVGRCVDPEVGDFFKKELISHISAFYINGPRGGYVKFLPQPEDIESAIPCDPAGQAISPEKIFEPNSLPINKTRVIVIGHSNMHALFNELKTTIEDTVVYFKYPFDVLASKLSIESFVAGLELSSHDICVLGGQGNSLLQGMLTPDYEASKPSGTPAESKVVGAGQTKVCHALKVASYYPEYFDNFGVFAEKLVNGVEQTGARVIFITPFPRYPVACCTLSDHFGAANYKGNLFNAEIVRLGTYISRMLPLKDAYVLTPEDLSLRDINDWVSKGGMIQSDGVHLTIKGLKAVVVATQKCLHLLKVAPPESKPLAGAPVPAGMLFSGWIKSYREVCGFKELIPHSYQKRTLAGNGQQGGPFKYRRH